MEDRDKARFIAHTIMYLFKGGRGVKLGINNNNKPVSRHSPWTSCILSP
jgi:hypothetical protein